MWTGKQMCKAIRCHCNSMIVHRYYQNMMDPELELKKIFKVTKVTTKQTESNNDVPNSS